MLRETCHGTSKNLGNQHGPSQDLTKAFGSDSQNLPKLRKFGFAQKGQIDHIRNGKLGMTFFINSDNDTLAVNNTCMNSPEENVNYKFKKISCKNILSFSLASAIQISA